MSGKNEITPFLYGVHSQIADEMSEIFFSAVCNNLKTFVTDGFLQVMFSKSGDSALDKATLLTTTFGKDANPKHYLEQSKATNIQPMTLSLIMSIATHSTAIGWDEYFTNTNVKITPTPNPVPISQQELPDIDKQVTNQSQKGNNNNQKKKSPANNSSKPAVIEVLTGYEVSSPEEKERTCDIIVYNIPYTWSPEKISAELKLWGNPIKLSIKRQHKYQTLRVKIALSSFFLLQFNNNWATDLGGIPVRWFPASWTFRERKQREKFQAVVYNILEDVTMHTLLRDQKPTTYLCELGAKSFKIVQTGKGKRKLVGYFETWEAIRKVLDYHQVLSLEGIRLSWCQHSTPNLKKVPTTKDRSGGKKTNSSNAKSKKKVQQFSSKAPKKK
ncbi:hypothetical protein C1646_768651 [Rhizophagus diaphanus]|nr:hypothetical protein C1646_768651 [Rhizophagus diaphanus] [Rhizophagus sp. MUCL 43196]